MDELQLSKRSRAILAVVEAEDVSTALRAAAAGLSMSGCGPVALYRAAPCGLELAGSDDGGAPWPGAPEHIASLPPGLSSTPVVLSGEGSAVDPRLAGSYAVCLSRAGEMLGLLLVQAKESRGAAAGDIRLAAALLASALEIARDRRELSLLRAEHYDTLLRAETMAATGVLSRGLAHELNNPLGVVSGLGEILCLDESLPEQARADIRVMVDETGRAIRVVNELLRYARRGEVDLERVDLGEVLELCANLFEVKHGAAGPRIEWDVEPGSFPVLGDAFRLQQALLAILDNAWCAISDAGLLPGKVVLGLRNVGERVELRITDTGPGIPEDVMPRIFDPFFTTREVGSGTGMGLALVMRTIQDLEGDIRCENRPEGGASFAIILDRWGHAL